MLSTALACSWKQGKDLGSKWGRGAWEGALLQPENVSEILSSLSIYDPKNITVRWMLLIQNFPGKLKYGEQFLQPNGLNYILLEGKWCRRHNHINLKSLDMANTCILIPVFGIILLERWKKVYQLEK